MSTSLPGRRAIVAAALAAPFAWRRAAAAAQIVVRTTGGRYDDIMRRPGDPAWAR